MSPWGRFLVIAALGAAAARASAQQPQPLKRKAGGAGHGHAAEPAPVRPRAPVPPRLESGAPARPKPTRMPPASRFDLKPQQRPEPQQQRPPSSQPQPQPQPRRPEQGQRRQHGERAQPPVLALPAHRAPDPDRVLRVPTLVERVRSHEKDETKKNHVYWHDDDRGRYAHAFDGKVHWYGFYDGPRYYWTRYHDNRWWWFDRVASRWLYWHDGYWWWNDPNNSTLIYVDVNDNYYPYADVAAVPQLAPGAAPEDTSAALAAAPAADMDAPSNKGYVSPDGTREVQIYGARQEAFLYDRTGGAPRFIAFLAAGARKAKFSDRSVSGALQILLMMADGSFDLYDANGKSLLQSSPNDDAAAPPGAPRAGASAAPVTVDADLGIPPSSPGAPPPPDSSLPPIPAR